MVTKCANPSCENLFHYLREGRLFLVEIPARPENAPGANQRTSKSKRECFWLCDICALTLTLTADKNGHVVLKSLSPNLKAA